MMGLSFFASLLLAAPAPQPSVALSAANTASQAPPSNLWWIICMVVLLVIACYMIGCGGYFAWLSLALWADLDFFAGIFWLYGAAIALSGACTSLLLLKSIQKRFGKSRHAASVWYKIGQWFIRGIAVATGLWVIISGAIGWGDWMR